MGHSLALLSNGEPRKAGLMEEILPKESTPNLEERGNQCTHREQGAFFWRTKLLYTQENISQLYKWPSTNQSSSDLGLTWLCKSNLFRAKTAGREG